MKFNLFRRQAPLTYDMLNQRQLMALKFKKHKLAVASAYMLVVLYTVCQRIAEIYRPVHAAQLLSGCSGK